MDEITDTQSDQPEPLNFAENMAVALILLISGFAFGATFGYVFGVLTS